MTCILIDDEADCLELLTLLIRKHCPEVQIIGQYDTPQSGIAAIMALRPSLVFLDVEMPEMNGFEVLEACKDIPFHLIFTTAFNEYAVKAFKYSAIGYLLKPIDQDDLKESVQRAQQILSIQQHVQQRDILFDFIHPSQSRREKIAIPSTDGMIFLPVRDILYCKADGNYTYIHRRSPENPLLFSKQLHFIEELLPADVFYRPHHSYLVNLDQVAEFIKGDGGELRMSNGALIPVARQKKEEILSLLQNR